LSWLLPAALFCGAWLSACPLLYALGFDAGPELDGAVLVVPSPAAGAGGAAGCGGGSGSAGGCGAGSGCVAASMRAENDEVFSRGGAS
jgi:hypothetical protein